MYSPKISEDLIPILYKKSKEVRKPMIKIVNEFLRDKLIVKQIALESTNPQPKPA